MENEIIQEFEELTLRHIDENTEIIFEISLFNIFEDGKDTGSEPYWELYNYINDELLSVGEAEIINQGYKVKATAITDMIEQGLDSIIPVAEPLKGKLEIKATGLNASSSDYNIQIKFNDPDNKIPFPYKTAGCVLKSRSKCYQLNTQQELAFRAYRQYQAKIKKTEQDHYDLVAKFKSLNNDDLIVEEQRFKGLEISDVKKVGLNITKLKSGDLLLEPNLIGQTSKDERLLKRELQYIKKSDETKTLHVGSELIQMDEHAVDGIKEIRKRSVINKEDVADFIKSPGSFINADLVDLDSGFSFRVEGLVEFTRIQNTDIDSTDNDWFLSNESISIDSFENHISSESELEDFQSRALNALENNSSKVLFKGKEFNIPPIHELEERIAVKKEALRLESNDQDESPEIQGATKQYTFAIKYFEENQRIRDLFQKYEMDAEVYNGLTISPYPHQKEASNWIYSLYRSAIQSNQEVSGGVFADDMGLGKTFSSLLGMKAISHYAKSQDQEFTNQLVQTFEKPFLVVAPLSLLENWHSEVHKFFDPLPFRDIVVLNSQSDLHRYRLEKGDEKSQSVSTDGDITPEAIQYRLKIGKQFGVERLDVPGRLILITYETLRNYQFSMARIPFSCVIFDEAQKIKNPDALATRAAKALISDVKIIATGTPVENNLDEYWCLMDTANPKLFGAQEIFKDQYSTPLKNSEGDELKLKIGEQLYQASGSFLLRRTKEELKDQLGKGLPEKIEYKGITDDGFSYLQSLDKQLTLQQLEAYDKIRKLRIENPQISSALQNLHRIKACMLHPRLTFTNRIEHMSEISSKEFWDESAKLMSMYEIIDRVRMKNQKLIVFIISRSVQYLVKRWIKVEFGIDPDIVSGETKVKANDESQTRLGKIDKFSNKDGFNVIILSPLAAGVGLNVTSANHVFHLERHWNPAKEAQANDRVYRIGQTKEVSIYYPIGKHPISESFDIKLDKLLSRKTFIKDALITYPRISEQELAEEMFE